jgi:Uma2 family endonuclease
MAVINPISAEPQPTFGIAPAKHINGGKHGDGEVYPSSDGKPMAETEQHRKLIVYGTETLEAYFVSTPDVYVSGNNFIYYEEGNAKARVSPDCYVVFGVPRRLRDSYKVWKEGGHVPNVVFEFTSNKTRKEDEGAKRDLYENVLRVPEYFLFDPQPRAYLQPRLQGFRLSEGVYVRLPLFEGRLFSQELGLEIVQEGAIMRFLDPRTGAYLLNPQELAQRVVDSEAEIARLRAELDALRRKRER